MQDPPNDGGLREVGDLGEDFMGMGNFDISPDNREALAVTLDGEESKLYTINLESGKAKMVGEFKIPVLGISFKTNPVAFATSSDNKLYRFNPMDSTMNAVDLVGLTEVEHIAGLDFRPVNGRLYAYTNSFAGATATVLYVLDSETDMLYRQDPPNDGVWVEIGSLGVEFEGENGFDIGGSSNNPFALLKVGSGSAVYSIDLMSGKARTLIIVKSRIKSLYKKSKNKLSHLKLNAELLTSRSIYK